MALTTQELNTVNWEWDQGGDQWGFGGIRRDLVALFWETCGDRRTLKGDLIDMI